MNEWVKQTNIKGPPGDQGIRGGTWYYGTEFPTPDPVRYIDGDMYLKTVDPNGGSVWRWNASSSQWVYTGADITGPPGPQGPSGGGASVGTAPPATPVLGQMWWHPTEKTLRLWDGTAWEPVLATWG